LTALSFPDVTGMQVVTTIADVAIVAFLVYQVMTLFRGTQAVSLIKGLAILFAANALAGLIFGRNLAVTWSCTARPLLLKALFSALLLNWAYLLGQRFAAM